MASEADPQGIQASLDGIDPPASPPPSSSPSNGTTTSVNPYLGHRHLTQSEAHLLGEYHRLSQTLRRILSLSASLSATKPHAQVLDSLRLTERKMGLVITLFKASVWSIMVEQDEKRVAMEEARRILEEEEEEEERRLREGSSEGERTVTYA